jgi:hypothetical protein
VPAGFVLVPVEPTLEMLTAASLEDDKAFIDGHPHGAARGDLWAAMLSAATTPQPAAEPTRFGAGDAVRIYEAARRVFEGSPQIAFDAIEWYHSTLLIEAGVDATPSAKPQPSDATEAMRRDADRYRWLRDPKNADRDEWNLFGPYSTPAEIDAVIDAAMAAKQESKHG